MMWVLKEDGEEVEVVQAPEVRACQGCVGHMDKEVCYQLPGGCSLDEIIWVEKGANDATN